MKDGAPDVEELRAKIGEQALESFLERALGSTIERKAVIGPDHALPLSRQAGLLNLSRSSLYYLAVPNCEVDLTPYNRMMLTAA